MRHLPSLVFGELLAWGLVMVSRDRGRKNGGGVCREGTMVTIMKLEVRAAILSLMVEIEDTHSRPTDRLKMFGGGLVNDLALYFRSKQWWNLFWKKNISKLELVVL
jgi:hypothetical protein